jgi:hypothetical protein
LPKPKGFFSVFKNLGVNDDHRQKTNNPSTNIILGFLSCFCRG